MKLCLIIIQRNQLNFHKHSLVPFCQTYSCIPPIFLSFLSILVSRWHEPPSHQIAGGTIADGNNLTPLLFTHQMAAVGQDTDHAVDAVHALVSLRTTPPRKEQVDESGSIKDLLMEEE